MKKSVYFLFFIILINLNVIKASEKISSISLNDIKIIFSTDAKTWNQNLVFLDKKLSMKKVQLENNNNYSLKTTFSNGYVVITPYFELDIVESLNINYYFNYYYYYFSQTSTSVGVGKVLALVLWTNATVMREQWCWW